MRVATTTVSRRRMTMTWRRHHQFDRWPARFVTLPFHSFTWVLSAVRFQSSPRAKPAIVDADADPLEAFMFELDATEDIVAQESVNDLSSRGMTPMPQQPQPSSNTISLEDILKMSTSSYTGEDQGGEGWESDARSEMTDDEGDSEAAHERDRHDFLKAVRSMQGTGGGAEARAGASAESSSGQGAADGDTIGAVSEVATLPSSKEGKGKVATLGRMFSDDGDVMEEHEREDQERNALELLQEAIKKKELAPVDHAQVDYVKVRKNLYIVPRALAHLAQPANAAKLADRREALGIKVRGKGCPPPVETWEHCGLPDKVLAQLRKVREPGAFSSSPPPGRPPRALDSSSRVAA
jgi:hypothetical protein